MTSRSVRSRYPPSGATSWPTGIRPTGVLVGLVKQLKAQVQELRQKGPAARAELDRTVANFTEFLDELTRDVDGLTRQLDATSREGDKKSLRQEVLGLLARSYASLGKHRQAAELLSRIPEPRGAGGKKPSPDEVKDYLETRILYAQELRQDGQFRQAEQALGEVGSRLEGQHNLSLIILGLEAEKEKIHLLEDRGEYSAAVSRWGTFMKSPQLKSLLADKDFEGVLAKYNEDDRKRMARPLERMHQDVVRMYFDCYYHRTYSLYKYGQNLKDARKRASYVKMAANNIVRLENAANKEGWRFTQDQFNALLQEEAPLKEQYELLKRTPR